MQKSDPQKLIKINGDIKQFFAKGDLILYNPHLELKGDHEDIKQFFPKGKLTLSNNLKLKGNYGSCIWWIPLSKDMGIKIYNNRRCSCYDVAEMEKKYRNEKWKKFFNKTNNCRKYLPEVYDWLVIKHTGKYVKGGWKTNTHGSDVDIYYPACIQRLYKKPEILSAKNKQEIRRVFESDGIHLKPDTFSIRQLGLYNDNFIVLDIEIEGDRKVI